MQPRIIAVARKSFWCLLLLVSPAAFSQTLTYYFNQSLDEANAGATLTELTSCSAAAGTFKQEIIETSAGACVDGTTGNTFQFNAGGGLQFSNANSLIGDSYTIHVFFKFSQDLNGYSRIIDFSNSFEDNGIYLYENCLSFYPSGVIGENCPFVKDKYFLVSFSRNGQNDQIDVYVDGILFTTYSDIFKLYVSAPATPLRFFRDDEAVTCEVKAGNIKYLSLSNETSTADDVKTVWQNICNIALPVTRVNFTGKIDGKNALLQWKTAAEYNASHFEIEHSTDGIRFATVGKVMAKGNSNELTNYEFSDRALTSGDNYYRLKEVDRDAKFTRSPVIKLTWNGSRTLQVYPVPARNEVSISGLVAGSTVQVFTMAGSRVLQELVTAQTTTLNISRLPAGSYYLRVWDGKSWSQQKIIKQ